MARYAYQARDGQGQLISGVVAAASVDEAGQMLRHEGKFIINLREAHHEAADQPKTNQGHARYVKRKDVILFAHQMAVMIDTGVPISEAMESIVSQAKCPHFKVVLRDVADQIESGNEFSTAMKRYPKVFPVVMTSMITAAEASGTMAKMLERISKYLSKEAQTVRQARGAMMYPLFMVFMTIAVTVFLLAFVLPKFTTIYASKEALLPLPTRILLAISGTLSNDWAYWVGGFAVIAVGGYIFSRTEPGKRALDLAKLKMPILGPMFRSMFITRACRTMGSMLAAGVGMLDMLAIVSQVTNNVHFQELWEQTDTRIKQGGQLSDCLVDSSLFPASIAQMIRSGEKSGRMGQVMDKVADFTEEEFDERVKLVTTFIEPIMVGTMGLIIGFIAIALLLPVFSMGQMMAG